MEDAAKEVLNDFVARFRNNPFGYLTECDLQGDLFASLRRRFPQECEVPAHDPSREGYMLKAVYTEYGGANHRSKFDIVCLDLEEIRGLPADTRVRYKGSDTYIFHLPIRIGIELKYVTMGYRKGVDIVDSDYEKLGTVDNVRHKLAMCFLQGARQEEAFLSDERLSGRCESMSEISAVDGIFAIGPDGVYRISTNAHQNTPGA